MCPARAAARPGNDGHAPVKIDHLSLPSLLSLSSLQHPFLQLEPEACIADDGVALPPSWTTIPSDSRSNVEENLPQRSEKDKPADRQRKCADEYGLGTNSEL